MASPKPTKKLKPIFSAHNRAICNTCDRDMELQIPTLVIGLPNLPHWLQHCNACGHTTEYVLDGDVSRAMEEADTIADMMKEQDQ